MPSDSLLVELSSEGLGSVDPDGVIHPANEALRNLLADCGAGRRLRDLPLHDEQRDGLASWLEGDRSPPLRVSVEGNGHRVGLRLHAGPDHEVIITACDESAIARYQRDLLHVERVRLLSELSSSIVHELNNHVGAILGFAEGLHSEGRAARDVRFLDSLRRSGRLAADLLHRVSAMLRTASERPQRRPLADVVAAVTRPVAKHLLTIRRELTLVEEGPAPHVRVHVDLLSQLLLPLLLGAAEAQPRGEPLRIVLGETRRPGAANGRPQRRFGVVSILDRSKTLRTLPDEVTASDAATLSAPTVLARKLVLPWTELALRGVRFEVRELPDHLALDVLLPATGAGGPAA